MIMIKIIKLVLIIIMIMVIMIMMMMKIIMIIIIIQMTINPPTSVARSGSMAVSGLFTELFVSTKQPIRLVHNYSVRKGSPSRTAAQWHSFCRRYNRDRAR